MGPGRRQRDVAIGLLRRHIDPFRRAPTHSLQRLEDVQITGEALVLWIGQCYCLEESYSSCARLVGPYSARKWLPNYYWKCLERYEKAFIGCIDSLGLAQHSDLVFGHLALFWEDASN
jgi:hypothetical protein